MRRLHTYSYYSNKPKGTSVVMNRRWEHGFSPCSEKPLQGLLPASLTMMDVILANLRFTHSAFAMRPMKSGWIGSPGDEVRGSEDFAAGKENNAK